MTRFFYRDPLAAAWMAKHFGMVFRENPPADEGWVDPLSDMRERYVVCPDSMALLEPQKHDLVDFGWIHPCGQSFHEMTLLVTSFKAFCDKSTCDYDSHRIIQRNGKAFMWPEVEP